MGRLQSTSNEQGRRLVGSKWNRVVDLQTELDVLETGQNDSKTPRGDAGQNLSPVEPSDVNHAEKVSEARKTGPVMRRRQQQPARINRDNNDVTSDTIQLTTAQDGSKLGLHGRRLCKHQTHAINTTQDPHRHDNDKPTNNAHDRSPRPRRRR